MDNEFGKKLKNMMRSNKVGRPAEPGKLGLPPRTLTRLHTAEKDPYTDPLHTI